MKLLVTAPVEFIPKLKRKMIEEFDCDFNYRSNKKELINAIKTNNYNAWIVSPCPDYFVDKEIIDLFSSLKIVASPTTGKNHIDFEYLIKKNIKFWCLKGTKIVNQIYSSSEFTFTLMIATLRKMIQASNSVFDGYWREKENEFRGRELNNLNLGIIGLGRIGNNLAKYSNAFGMNIYGYDPYKDNNLTYINQLQSMKELIKRSDVICICVDLNLETTKLIGKKEFQQMKDGVYLINTSRGEVIDEEQLLVYLKNGKIKGAGLDVISGELVSEIKNHPLVQYAKNNDNLIITPHIAGLTYDSEMKAQTAAYNYVKSYLTNKI